MKFTIPLLRLEIEINARFALAIPHNPPTAEEACSQRLGDAWHQLILKWDVPPECLFGAADRDLTSLLQAALASAGAECAKGRPNPLSQVPWQKSYGHSRWDGLARRISSPKAIPPTDPFHKARILARLGTLDTSIDFSGQFAHWTQTALDRMDPSLLVEAAELLGSAASKIALSPPPAPAVQPSPSLPIADDAKSAIAAAFPPIWNDLALRWDVAPEGLAYDGRNLTAVLRAAVRGGALAMLRGAPNPIEAIAWPASPGTLGTYWDGLARRISSPKAMDKEDPFFEARSLSVIGQRGLCDIGDDGQFSFCYTEALRRMEHLWLAQACAELAASAESILMASSCSPSKPSSKRGRL